MGFRVKAVSSGLQALEHLRDGLQPQVILLDIMMERIDGLTFMNHLREMPNVGVDAGRRDEHGRGAGALRRAAAGQTARSSSPSPRPRSRRRSSASADSTMLWRFVALFVASWPASAPRSGITARRDDGSRRCASSRATTIAGSTIAEPDAEGRRERPPPSSSSAAPPRCRSSAARSRSQRDPAHRKAALKASAILGAARRRSHPRRRQRAAGARLRARSGARAQLHGLRRGADAARCDSPTSRWCGARRCARSANCASAPRSIRKLSCRCCSRRSNDPILGPQRGRHLPRHRPRQPAEGSGGTDQGAGGPEAPVRQAAADALSPPTARSPSPRCRR